MRNWFETLNDALSAEGLVDLWPLGSNIGYGETVYHIVEDLVNHKVHPGTRLISVYRDETGRYERPIHYSTC